MSIFSKLKSTLLKTETVEFPNNITALCILLHSIANIDGESLLDEDAIANNVSLMCSTIARDKIDTRFAGKFISTYDPATAIVLAFNELSEDLHKTAFFYCAMVACVDEEITSEEQEMLLDLVNLSEELDIEIAQELLNVAEIAVNPFY